MTGPSVARGFAAVAASRRNGIAASGSLLVRRVTNTPERKPKNLWSPIWASGKNASARGSAARSSPPYTMSPTTPTTSQGSSRSRNQHQPPDGRLVPEELARQRFVGHQNAPALGAVSTGEGTTVAKAESHRLEVAGAGDLKRRPHHLVRIARHGSTGHAEQPAAGPVRLEGQAPRQPERVDLREWPQP